MAYLFPSAVRSYLWPGTGAPTALVTVTGVAERSPASTRGRRTCARSLESGAESGQSRATETHMFGPDFRPSVTAASKLEVFASLLFEQAASSRRCDLDNCAFFRLEEPMPGAASPYGPVKISFPIKHMLTSRQTRLRSDKAQRPIFQTPFESLCYSPDPTRRSFMSIWPSSKSRTT